jgi:hypothetical protein
MGVEHELSQRSVHPRQRALQGYEPGAGDPGRRIEIHPAIAGPQLHVIRRLEIEPGRIAPAPFLPVVGLVSSVGHIRVRYIGNTQTHLPEFLLHHDQILLRGLELPPDLRHLRQ